jgi:hypothetical protein
MEMRGMASAACYDTTSEAVKISLLYVAEAPMEYWPEGDRPWVLPTANTIRSVIDSRDMTNRRTDL